MLRRAACLTLLLGLAACNDKVILEDLWDASAAAPDAGTSRDVWPYWQMESGCYFGPTNLQLTVVSPQIMLVLDRSSNMQAAFPGASSKLAAVQGALSDAIASFQYRIQIGLEQFPSDANSKSGGCSHATCCSGPPAPEPGGSGSNELYSQLYCSDPQSCGIGGPDAPAHRALEQVRTYYSNLFKSPFFDRSQHAIYVVLITAAEPSCSDEGSGADVCDVASSAATDLTNDDIPLVIVSVGDQPDGNACLTRLSKVGNSALPGNIQRLNAPSSTSALHDTIFSLFQAIETESCTLLSEYTPIPGDALVWPGGSSSLSQGDANGWVFASDDHERVRLAGNACNAFVAAQGGLHAQASYICSTCASDANSCPWP